MLRESSCALGGRGGDSFAITVPVVAESLFGIGLLPRTAQNLAETPGPTARNGRCLHRGGCIRYNLVLLTTDNDFTPVPNLKIENWQVPWTQFTASRLTLVRRASEEGRGLASRDKR